MEEKKVVPAGSFCWNEGCANYGQVMNGRLVRKTFSFSKELRFLEAASCWEDALYNFTRPVKTLRVEREDRSTSARLSTTNTGHGC